MKLCEKHAGLPGAPRADGSCRWCEPDRDGESFVYEDHGPMAEWTQRLFCKPTFVVPPGDFVAALQSEMSDAVEAGHRHFMRVALGCDANGSPVADAQSQVEPGAAKVALSRLRSGDWVSGHKYDRATGKMTLQFIDDCTPTELNYKDLTELSPDELYELKCRSGVYSVEAAQEAPVADKEMFAKCLQREIDGAHEQIQRELTAYDAMAKSTLAGSHLMHITLPSSEPVSPERAAKQREQDELCRVLRRDKERAKLRAELVTPTDRGVTAPRRNLCRELLNRWENVNREIEAELEKQPGEVCWSRRPALVEAWCRSGLLARAGARELLGCDPPDAWFEPSSEPVSNESYVMSGRAAMAHFERDKERAKAWAQLVTPPSQWGDDLQQASERFSNVRDWCRSGLLSKEYARELLGGGVSVPDAWFEPEEPEPPEVKPRAVVKRALADRIELESPEDVMFFEPRDALYTRRDIVGDRFMCALADAYDRVAAEKGEPACSVTVLGVALSRLFERDET